MNFFVDRLAKLFVLLLCLLALSNPARADLGFTWVVEPRFEDAGAPMDGVVPLKIDGLWGLMGGDGVWVVPPSFDAMGPQSEGVFSASLYGRWGAVDSYGLEKIPFVYDKIGRPGLITPVLEETQWRVIDEVGKSYPLDLDTLTMSEGFCFVGEARGATVIEWQGPRPKRSIASDIGIASVVGISGDLLNVVLLDGSNTLIECDEQLVDEYRYHEDRAFPEEIGVVREGSVPVRRGDAWGFDAAYRGFDADYRGFSDEDIPVQYNSAGSFSEGLAAVEFGSGKWGYVDRSGAVVVEAMFDKAYTFSNGIAGVRMGDKRGFIDPSGALLIEPEFEDFWRSDSGLISVKQSGKWGIISPKGSMVAESLALKIQETIGLTHEQPTLRAISEANGRATKEEVFEKFEIKRRKDGEAILLLRKANNLNDDDSALNIWDLNSNKLITAVKPRGALSAEFLPNSRVVIVGTQSGDLVFYDTNSGQELLRKRVLPGAVRGLVVSPNGAFLAALGGGWLQVWSLSDGNLIQRRRSREIVLSFSLDSQAVWMADLHGFVQNVTLERPGSTSASFDLGAARSDPTWLIKLEPSFSPLYLHDEIAISANGVLIRSVRSYDEDEYNEDDLEENENSPPEIETCSSIQHDAIETKLWLSTVDYRGVFSVFQSTHYTNGLAISSDGNQILLGPHVFSLREHRAERQRDLLVPYYDCVDGDRGPEIETGYEFASEDGRERTQGIKKNLLVSDTEAIMVNENGEIIRSLVTNDGGAQASFIGIFGDLTGTVNVGLEVFNPEEVAFVTVNRSGLTLEWDLMALHKGPVVLHTKSDADILNAFRLKREVILFRGSNDEPYLAVDIDSSSVRLVQEEELSPIDFLVKMNLAGQVGLDERLSQILADYLFSAENVQDPESTEGQISSSGARVFDNGRLVVRPVGHGAVYEIVETDHYSLVATLTVGADQEWLLLTPEGFFAASKHGGRLVSISNGLQAWSVDQVYQALYRPDLVAAKLAGDPDGNVASAAVKLDLEAVFSSGPAPDLRLISPMGNVETSERAINFSVLVEDAGGGVGKLEWRVNGVTQSITKLDGEGVARARISLLDGENEIEVVAYNKAGLITSVPVSMKMVRQGTDATGNPILHVLAIGVNEYSDGRIRLAYAAPDARAFSDAMGLAAKGLLGADPSVNLILDAEATDESIDAAFSRLSSVVKPTDVFVLFVAGHGKTIEGRYHFLPADFRFDGEDAVERNGISQDRWQDWLSRVPAQKSVLIFDTCESGAMTAARSVEDALRQSAAIDRLTRAVGRTVLSATSGEDDAYEGFRGHGVMTYALLEGLNEGDADNNGTIEVTELANYLDRRVPEISYSAFGLSQVPQMSISGSDFSIARTGVVSSIASKDDEDDNGQNYRFPEKVTHVVVGRTEVLDAPGGQIRDMIESEGVVGVYLISEEAGFARIARDGSELGWVRSSDIKRVQ